MLGSVKAFDFFLFADTQTVEFFDCGEYNQHCAYRPRSDADKAKRLNTELSETAAVE